MTNFPQMRKNMVLGQFLPESIKDKKVLKAYETIPREKFLPDQFKPIAYSDLNIKIAQSRYIPSPLNSAKIFQEASFKGKEVVLLIGANYGYEAVVLSSMVDTIIAIEEDIKLTTFADNNIKGLNIENLVLLNSNHSNGYKKLGLYDIIICLDLRYLVNEGLINQLVEEGKIFFCEQHNNEVKESKLSVIYKSKKSYIKQTLFDINIPFVNLDDNNNFKFS